MLPYIAEFLGTMILIILGDGVVANVNLNKSGMKGGGTVQITIAWGLAVMLPACIFGAASGASFNPALTLALAIDGSFAWSMVPGYIVAQFAGAFVGGAVVYLLFKGQFDATEDQATKLGVFCTAPSVPNLGLNIFSEAVGTFILVFAIKGMANYRRTWQIYRIWNHRFYRYVTRWSDRICNQPGKRSWTTSGACSTSNQGKRKFKLGIWNCDINRSGNRSCCCGIAFWCYSVVK